MESMDAVTACHGDPMAGDVNEVADEVAEQ